MQWLQNPNQSDVDNLNYVRHEASRQFRKEKKKYLKDEINALQTNKNNKNIRELYRTISDSKTPSIFWLDGEIIFLSY